MTDLDLSKPEVKQILIARGVNCESLKNPCDSQLTPSQDLVAFAETLLELWTEWTTPKIEKCIGPDSETIWQTLNAAGGRSAGGSDSGQPRKFKVEIGDSQLTPQI